MSDGKSIVMEGMHLDPGLYLYEFGRHSQLAGQPAHDGSRAAAATQPLHAAAAPDRDVGSAASKPRPAQALRVDVDGADGGVDRCRTALFVKHP